MNGMGTEIKELQCPQAKRLFSPYLDGAVTGTEMLALQNHLSGCADCNRQYLSLRNTQQLLTKVARAKRTPASELQTRGHCRTRCNAKSILTTGIPVGMRGSAHLKDLLAHQPDDSQRTTALFTVAASRLSTLRIRFEEFDNVTHSKHVVSWFVRNLATNSSSKLMAKSTVSRLSSQPLRRELPSL